MKKYLLLLMFALIPFLFSCEMIIPDLERNNPYDSAYNGNESDKIRELEYYNHSVACKTIGEPPYMDYSDINIIKPGDNLWLRVEIKNSSNFHINKIRGTINSQSSLVSIVTLEGSEFLKFTESTTEDYISYQNIGWGVIQSGNGYVSAPNYNDYSVEFSVDSSASKGDKIPFNVNLTDELGNSWNFTFNVVVD